VAILVKRAVRYFLSSYAFSVWMLAVLAAVVTAPFGAHVPMGAVARLPFWAVTGAVGIVLGQVIHALCQRRMGGRHRPLAGWMCELGIFTVVFSPLVYVLAQWLSDGMAAGPEMMARIAGFVLMAAFVITALRRILLNGGLMQETSGALGRRELAAPPLPKPPRLSRRLPDGAADPVLHLSAMDHFVTVETPDGEYCLRMRLRDAIDEMDGVEGFRTHRSHWVARAAIRAVTREEGRVVLVLANGVRVPVSRKHRSELEAAGIV
jgi:hypothetical protein